jgi:hypothetical protein
VPRRAEDAGPEASATKSKHGTEDPPLQEAKSRTPFRQGRDRSIDSAQDKFRTALQEREADPSASLGMTTRRVYNSLVFEGKRRSRFP